MSEVFNVKYKVSEYHYTLYYYDQANNLIKTVPPAGVNIITNATILSTIKQYRLNGSGTPFLNVHRLQTVYHYNSLNQVVDQQTPDVGVSNFWYDRLGRLILSQNARQKIDVAYSYTLFDKLGRITEVGETKNAVRLDTTFKLTKSRIVVVCKDTTVALTKDTTVALYKTATLKQWFTTKTYTYRMDSTYSLAYNSTYKICKDSIIYYSQDTTVIINKSDTEWVLWQAKGTKRQITRTTYDAPLSTTINNQFGTKGQETPRNRVTTSAYYENGTDAAFQHATHYSYDILGNVKTLIQDYPEFAKKRMDYQFDQLSGKVNLVAYQAGQVDAFYHRYSYDADLRLRAVETSRDFVIWDNDATYKYYRHGPLRRMEIGQDKIQGVDYYYSIQGWIKGVNHGAGGADSIGREGVANTMYANFAQDAFAYNLSYHTDDYKPISSNFAFDATEINHKIDNISPSLFNGNIRAMWGGLDKFAIATNAVIPPSAQGQVFQYDQLNRLLQSKDFTYFPNGQSAITSFAHSMKLTYDPNGNIKTLNRFGVVKTGNSGVTTAMDNLTYTYQPNTNKLTHVDDSINKNNFDNDIDDQDPNNYTYDAIGNLISDNAEEIQNITWNVYGKMTSVVNVKKERSLNFYYDAAGNRVKKIDGKDKATYYVRDAQGNVMAVYEKAKPNQDVFLQSFYIYGSSRIGEVDTAVNMQTATVSTTSFSRIRGIKRYEMSNHLGNVMVVVSDRKVYDGSVFKADLVSTTDYYAFGMVMSDRSWNTEGYRFGFNGKENDNEVKGTGNSVAFEMRIYDSRLGRFLSRDPLEKKYPNQSTYVFAANSPISLVDVLGMEAGDPPTTLYHNTEAGKNIVTNGFDGAAKGKYSKYNWFSATSNAAGTGRTGTGVTLELEGINIKDAHVITNAQTAAWELESMKELGYQDKASFNTSKKSLGKEAFSELHKQMRGKMYSKIGAYMDNMNQAAYFLERDGTYALSDALANSGTIAKVSGSAVAIKALNGLKWAGRILMVVAIANDLYEIHNSGYEPRTIVKKAGFWTGAWAGGTIASAGYGATGADLLGPWSWVAHGVVTLGGGILGGFAGEAITENVYDYVTKKGVKPGMK